MERYIHNANMAHYRHLIAESERDPRRDEDRHKMLLTCWPRKLPRTESEGRLLSQEIEYV
jgi:hypothetical protein